MTDHLPPHGGVHVTSVARLFDRYVMVDWSANNRRKKGRDSIWVRSVAAADDARDVIQNPATRHEATEIVRALLVDSVGRNERVLVGFDFPYGYPSGFAAALGLDGVPWRATWTYLCHEIQDSDRNRSNRFEVAARLNETLVEHCYWGRPAKQVLEHLSSGKDTVVYRGTGTDVRLSEWRQTERALHGCGVYPQPVWKLLGAGSVGSQALVGIPRVASLRDDPALGCHSLVWPFEVVIPATEPGVPAVVHAEVWPSLVDIAAAVAIPTNAGKVRDQVQVEQLALHLRQLDDDARLVDLFAAAPPSVVDEEGWILGAVGMLADQADGAQPREQL